MKRLVYRIVLFLSCLALSFSGVVSNGAGLNIQPAQAGSGAAIQVPFTDQAPVSGPCNRTEFSDATRVQFTVPDPNYPTVTVYLMFSSNYLYICFGLMPMPETGNVGYVGVYVDRSNDGGSLSGTDDFFLGVHPDGSSFGGYWNPTSGAYDGADPGGWWAFAEPCGAGCEWAYAFFKIPRQALGGWQHKIGLAFAYQGYQNPGDSFSWPANGVLGNPGQWGSAALFPAKLQVDQSTKAPSVDGYCADASTPGSEYADATPFTLSMGASYPAVPVYVKHTATDLYVCMSGIPIPGGFYPNKATAALYINRLGAGGETPYPDDMLFSITYNGAVHAYRGSGGAFWGPDPGGYTIVTQAYYGEISGWNAEFRISAATLGGGWDRNINLSVQVQRIEGFGEYAWPIGSNSHIPNTWGLATLTGIPATEPGDLAPTAMEVTQSIQDLNNSVVLVAGKRTFVRLYVTGTKPASQVTARLYGLRNGVSLGAPLIPLNTNGVINVKTSPDRNSLDDSFLFELPADWITAQAAPLYLSAQINPFHFTRESNYNNDVMYSNALTFAQTNPLNLVLYDYQFLDLKDLANDPWVANPQRDLRMLKSELRRMYPISDLNVRDRVYAHVGWYVSVCNEFPYFCFRSIPDSTTVNLELAAIRALWLPVESPAYYGMVYDRGDVAGDLGSTFMRGLGIPTLGVASGANGPYDWGWDFDGTYGDWVGAHEIAHTLWRFHTLCQGEDGPYQNYPSDRGGTLGGQFAGFDAGDFGLGIPQRVMPGSTWHDLMSYCGNLWTSDITYTGIRNFLQTGLPLSAAQDSVTNNGLSATTQGDFLTVAGLIDIQHQVAGFASLARQTYAGLIPPLMNGGYHIRLLGAGNNILADDPFTPALDAEPATSGSFFQVVSYKPGTSRIAIYSDSAGKEIASRTVSANPPSVSITSRSGGPSLPASGPVTLAWNGSDPDGDPLTYSLQYSSDNRGTWRTLIDGLTTGSATVDASQLEGTGKFITAYFRVVANDGVLTAFADSDAFSVENKAPEIELASPADGSSYIFGQVVTLEGYADDFEDGTLSDSQLTWTSNRDGALGTGHLLSPAFLSVGDHQITLTAVDSSGQSATKTVTVHIAADAAEIQPSLEVSPGNLFFMGNQGGASPASQTLNVRSASGNEMHWTATSSASWVKLSSTSGVTPENLQVTVDMDGLWASPYRSAQVTITSTEVTNSPVTIEIVAHAIDYHPIIFLPLVRR